jgi:hypothetical protein
MNGTQKMTAQPTDDVQTNLFPCNHVVATEKDDTTIQKHQYQQQQQQQQQLSKEPIHNKPRIDRNCNIGTLRGHSCQCIWKVDYHDQYHIAATAGNDGTIAFYPIQDYVMIRQRNQIDNNDKTPTSYPKLFRLPEDPCIVDNSIHNNPSNDIPSPMTVRITPTWTEENDMIQATKSKQLPVLTAKLDKAISEAQSQLVKKKKTRKKKIMQQVVIGMNFFLKNRNDKQQSLCLAVATRSGSFMYRELSSSSYDDHDDYKSKKPWIHCEPWYNNNPFLLANNHDDPGMHRCDKRSVQGCCMSIHPTSLIAAFGNTNGNIILSPIRPRGHEEQRFSHDIPELHQRNVMLYAIQQRAVQKLLWISDHILLSFHATSVIWWRFDPIYFPFDIMSNAQSDDLRNNDIYHSLISRTVLSTNTNGMAISCDYHFTSHLLAIGDTRGNITIFDMNNDVTLTKSKLTYPLYSLSRVHQKEHVLDIVWKDSSRILSVGNDGCIAESIIHHHGDGGSSIQKILSLPVGACTGLSYIWSWPTTRSIMMPSADNTIPSAIEDERVIVGGYFGNRFTILDYQNGYEFFSVDTGGRQRLLEIYLPSINRKISSQFPISLVCAICCNNVTNGSNDILLQRTKSCGWTIPLNDYSIGWPCHGETIFDLCWFPIEPTNQTLALLTGSEDCSSKVFIYDSIQNVCIKTKQLPPQVSGIRAVCSCTFYRTDRNTSSTLIVVGGKLTIECYMVVVEGTMTNIDIVPLCRGILPDKFAIDHRINCVKSVPLPTTRYDEEIKFCLVVTGDSNGSCYLYLVSDTMGCTKPIEGRLLYRHERPIVSLEILFCGQILFLFVGTTAGDLLVFSLQNFLALLNSSEFHAKYPLLQYCAHRMGTNTISARCVEDNTSDCKRYTIRVCSGGDDQRLTLVDLEATVSKGYSNSLDLRMVKEIFFENAALSALKGVSLIQHNRIVATGYDQQLCIWGYDDNVLAPLSELPIDIGDINCLTSYGIGHDKHLLAVGGAGIEIIALDIPGNHILNCKAPS